MKLFGSIDGTPIRLLVDSGASHNFISHTLVRKLGLSIDDTTEFGVHLGDGHRVLSRGLCKELKVQIGDIQIAVDCYPFDLGGVDLILGVAWLEKLGKMRVEWRKMYMKFTHNGREVTIQGDPTLTRTQVSLKSLLKISDVEYGKVVWMQHIEDTSLVVHLSPQQQAQLDTLLAQFGRVFDDHHSLPPVRPTDHAIVIKPGVIQPSCSPFSSPVILVRKKDGSWRFCIDYRALNAVTIPDKYPTPVIDELLDELNGAQFFSKVDLRSVMPFGLMNAPSTFQATMNDAFRPFLRRRTWEDHLQQLTTVLYTLAHHRFVANQGKCYFGQQSVEYLGYVISEEGVAIDPKKVSSVLQWPTPSTPKAVRGFLGLTGYYRKFIRDYGKIARPLTDLLKKDNFVWGPEAAQVFDILKKVMTTAPVLALPDFAKEFTIECDASGRGLGVVLMQESRPIAFFSKALGERALTKSTYEKELMALVLAIQHWRPYLLGRRFKVLTDQKSLRFLLHQRITTPDQQNWLAKLLGYDFDIVYKPGTQNRAADALSRIHEDITLCAISCPQWIDVEQLQQDVYDDPALAALIQQLSVAPDSRQCYRLVHGQLLYKNRLVIPARSRWVPLLLSEFHATPIGGHSGAYRTYRRLAANVYWRGKNRDIYRFVAECDICQRQKYQATSPAGLLQPLPVPERVWEDISMDFITGLPRSRGHDTIHVVVDRLTKYAHFLLIKHPYSARTVAELFCKGSRPSPWHPTTTKFMGYLWLHWAKYWYNTTFHVSANSTPFQLVYGRPPPALLHFVPGETIVEAVAQELVDRDEILRQLKHNLHRAQNRMTKFANAHRKDLSFQEGEWVYLKLRPHRQQSVSRRVNQKLAARFYGPFKVLQRVGAVAYKLELPPGSRVHPIFHASLLKRAIGARQPQIALPDSLADEAVLFEPAAVLAIRTVMNDQQQVNQVLVQWKGKPVDEATWEDTEQMQHQFPTFSLGDKANLEKGGIVRDTSVGGPQKTNQPILRVYSRRHKKGIERGSGVEGDG
ncbi:hypothetical protein H6P81_003194 [Aristolochia fimbriata]|uniref:Uncharacterized protein n=1 Tax=Aristolochia fimbriata TaxID=158543 RepID=A0AAV7FFS5_ARIFI|nr:hypothetical protein H6P81_003194 [Aristolochia fimbriata]